MIFCSLIFVQCKDKKESTVSEVQTEMEEESNKGDIQKLKIIEGFSDRESDNFEVENASLEGDILSIDISYSGGCEDHEFDLYFNGAYMKSLPPKANLFLKHNANGDACRSMIKQTLRFNIKKVKASYDSVILYLNNYTEQIVYK